MHGLHPEAPWGIAEWNASEAEIRYGNGADATTKFMIGSVTKTVTGRLLAEAALDGGLEFDEPLPGPAYHGQRVTPGHLASHLSGLPRLPGGFIPESDQPYADWSAERLERAFVEARLEWRPGSQYAYSNFGAAALGLEIARRRGVPYERLAIDLLKRMGCADPDFDLPAPGLGYQGERVNPWQMAAFAPAGGLTMTLPDLVIYGQSVQKETSEAARLIREWRPTKLPEPLSLESILRRLGWRKPLPVAGLGWHLGAGWMQHEGKVAGYGTFLALGPDGKGRAVVSASMQSEVSRATLQNSDFPM